MTGLTHSQVREELVALVYGELAPEAARAMEEHLAGCAECRAERVAMADTRRRMRALTVEAPRPGWEQAVLAQAREQTASHQRALAAGRRASFEAGKKKRPWWLALVMSPAFAMGAGLVVVAGASWWALQSGQAKFQARSEAPAELGAAGGTWRAEDEGRAGRAQARAAADREKAARKAKEAKEESARAAVLAAKEAKPPERDAAEPVGETGKRVAVEKRAGEAADATRPKQGALEALQGRGRGGGLAGGSGAASSMGGLRTQGRGAAGGGDAPAGGPSAGAGPASRAGPVSGPAHGAATASDRPGSMGIAGFGAGLGSAPASPPGSLSSLDFAVRSERPAARPMGPGADVAEGAAAAASGASPGAREQARVEAAGAPAAMIPPPLPPSPPVARFAPQSAELSATPVPIESGFDALFAQAATAEARGDCPEAARLYRAARSAEPRSPRAAAAMLAEAHCLARSGRTAEAHALYLEILRLHPSTDEAQAARAALRPLFPPVAEPAPPAGAAPAEAAPR